jgi:hypothetical protein
MSAAIVGYASVTAGCEEEHLVFEGVCVKGPTVAKDYWLSISPVFVEDFCSIRDYFCHAKFLLLQD